MSRTGRIALAGGLVTAGVLLVLAAAVLIYWPAALAVGGVVLVAVGLLGVDVDEPTRQTRPQREPVIR